jgi:hypothetical protein
MKKSKVVVLSAVFHAAVISCLAQHPVEIESVNGKPYKPVQDSIARQRENEVGQEYSSYWNHGFFWRLFHSPNGIRSGGFGRSAHKSGG